MSHDVVMRSMQDYFSLGSPEAIMERLVRDKTSPYSRAWIWAHAAIDLLASREIVEAQQSLRAFLEEQAAGGDVQQRAGTAVGLLLGVLGSTLAVVAILIAGMPGLPFIWNLVLVIAGTVIGLTAGGLGGRRLLRGRKRK